MKRMEVVFYLLGNMMKTWCVLVCFLGDDYDNI